MNKIIDIEKVISVIKDAGKMINYNFRFKRNIIIKGKSNYVTDLDKTIEQFIIDVLTTMYPQLPFFSEESSSSNNLQSTYWVLDPIDGTTNLIHGYPSVCISLALIRNGKTILGIVYCPPLRQLYFAEYLNGAYLQKDGYTKRINVSDCSSVKNSIIGFGCPYNKKRVPLLFDILKPLLLECDDIKRSGPASLDMCYVASGKLDAFIELDLEIWDFLAGALILEEAGGIITDIKGNPIKAKKNSVLVSNGYIHSQILDTISNII